MLDFAGLIRFAIGYAKRQMKVAYIYQKEDGKFFISMKLENGYLVKVFPGGRRVFSPLGVKLAGAWLDGIEEAA